MTDRELMQLALEALEVLEALFNQAEAMHENMTAGVNVHCQITVADLSKGLYAAAAIREALAGPDYKALYEKAAQQYNKLAELMAEQPAKEKAPDSANSEAPGWIISDHARRDDCTTEQPYPDNFIDALMYDVARRDSEAQQAYEDAFINGTGVMLGDKRIDAASIYKQPAQQQEPVAVARVDDLERGGRVRALAMGLGLDQLLYTSPPASKPWVGLTDEEIQKCYETTGHYQTLRPQDRFAVFALARAIEAAHGIKGEA